MSSSLKRDFLERWVMLNVAYGLAFWLSINVLIENPLVLEYIRNAFGAFLLRALFLHAVPLNVMYLLATAHCQIRPAERWHEHRVFFLMLLVLGVLWAVFLPGEIIRH